MSRKVTLTVPVDIVVRDRDVHVLTLVKKAQWGIEPWRERVDSFVCRRAGREPRHRASCPCFVRGGGLSDGESQPHGERWSA